MDVMKILLIDYEVSMRLMSENRRYPVFYLY